MDTPFVASPEAVKVEAAPSSSQSSFILWPLVCLIAIIIFFSAIRWRLADTPLERDEGEYAYAGQLMLQGITPYKLAYNMKLPGTYAAYAAMMKILGETTRGIHLGLMLASAAATLLMYLLAAQLFGPWAAMAAAIAYELLTTVPATLGLAGHATHFVVFAAIPALILLLLAEKRGRLPLFFWSGIFFGIALLMKQPGVFFGAFGFCYLAYFSWRATGGWSAFIARAAIFVAGCAAPFLITCLIMWRAGVLANFWFWTFSYARQYSGLVSLTDGWELFTYHFARIFAAAPGVWVLAGLGIVGLLWRPQLRRNVAFVLGLLVFSGLGVSSGLYFRFHYFLLAIPAVALLVGAAIEFSVEALKTRLLALRALPLAVFAIVFIWGVAVNFKYYFRLNPIQACRETYGMNEGFPEAQKIAAYLEQNTKPSDRIGVLGSEPEIYFYSHRISATGYIYTYPLMENQPYWQKMQPQMISEIESSRPAFLVYFNDPNSWLTTMGSSRLRPFMEWAGAYVKSGYQEVGMVELTEPESHFFWGDDVKTAHPQGASTITIFKRKD